jgi:hypothetical protein
MITVQQTFVGAKDFLIAGKYFKLLSAAHPVDIRFSGGSSFDNEATGVTVGFYAEIDFDKVRIVADPSGDTIKFIVSDGTSGNDAIITVTSLAKPATIDTAADVALAAGVATQILAFDSSRQQAFISNLGANLNLIRIGDNNVAAARGAEIAPGQTIMIAGTEAIFGFSPALQNVGVTTVRD